MRGSYRMNTRNVRRLAALLVCAVLAVWGAAPARAHDPSGSDHPLDQVKFEQRLNAQIPLDLTFRDAEGVPVQLGEYVGDTPVILMFAYYGCPNICDLALEGLTTSLRALKFNMGDDYQVVTVSIDPDETPALAADKKATYTRHYGRSGADRGWHFLTGEHEAIDALADTVGFTYAYDPKQDQYAHATGIMILTPEGRLSHYLYGIEFSPKDVQLALVEASSNTIGSPVDQFLLRCFHYDPVAGTYTLTIMNVLRIAGVLTTVLLGAGVLYMLRRSSGDDQLAHEHV